MVRCLAERGLLLLAVPISTLWSTNACAAAEAEGSRFNSKLSQAILAPMFEMQIQRGGCATGLVSIPLRYMHTPTEVVKLSDIEDTVTLLKRFILDLDEDVSFVPGM